jgi:hypothetical protein
MPSDHFKKHLEGPVNQDFFIIERNHYQIVLTMVDKLSAMAGDFQS